jgi:hypothetical protein
MGAPFPPVPNAIRFKLAGSGSGEIWENIFYYQYSGVSPTVTAMNSLCASMLSQFSGQMAALIHPSTFINSVTGVDLNSTNGVEGTSQLVTAGTATGGPLPLNTAMLVSHPASARWKGGHFRTYLAIGTDTNLADQMHWTTAFTNSAQTQFNAFLSNCIGITSGGTTLTAHIGVRYHSKFLTNNGPPHFVLATPVALQIASNTSVTHNQLSTQKGRIGRRRK